VAYLLAFSPWLAFAVIPGAEWGWAALLAVVLSVVGIARLTRDGLPLDAQIIAIGSAAYFAGLAILAFADPHTALHAYTAALASAALGLIGTVSLALRKPYTLGIAKQDIPREHWENPLFFRVNVIVTAVWTASFIAAAIALAALAHSSTMSRSIVQTAAFIIPMAFTARYVGRVRAEAQAAEAAAEAQPVA
jgi:hypothetical protein